MMSTSANKHHCPTCKIIFSVTENSIKSPHYAMYMHMVNTHSMRVNISCHHLCQYIVPKRKRAVKI